MKTLPGTRRMYASQLQIGDNIVDPKTGEYDSTVEDIYNDPEGTWLDTGDSVGYLDGRTEFLIEWIEQ